MLKGIDVSKHNGVIDWMDVKYHIDFAMLRAGYGKNNIDTMFNRNAAACERYGIPYGVYWFSYAHTPEMARNEAKYCLEIISEFNPTYPVCFDFEYDSAAYAKKNGVTVTKKLMCDMAIAFLSEIEKAGYYAMNYTNIDYLNKGFSSLTSKYDTWLAQWSVKTPSKPCGIWQYSDNGKVAGIAGKVDMNYSYHDYAEIINKMRNKKDNNRAIVKEKAGLEEITMQYLDNYKYSKELYKKLANSMR